MPKITERSPYTGNPVLDRYNYGVRSRPDYMVLPPFVYTQTGKGGFEKLRKHLLQEAPTSPVRLRDLIKDIAD